MDDLLPVSYPYRPKATTMVLCILFFGACAGVLGVKAETNDRGLILNGIVTFSETGASMFYWILAGLCLGFVVMGILLIIQRFAGSSNLEITRDDIRIPRGFIKKTINSIPFGEVESVSETEVQGQRFFFLHAANRKYCVNRAFMPSSDDYEEVKLLIGSILASQNNAHTEQDAAADADKRRR